VWEPVGPLPASVYWRRRRVAAAAALTVLVLLGWSVTAAFVPSGDGATTRAASQGALAASQQAFPPPVAPAAAAPPSLPGAEGPSPVVSGGAPSPFPPEPGAPVSTSEELLPDDTPRESVPAPTPAQVPPTGPVPCANAMVGVTAEVDGPERRVGRQPVLRLVVTNISDQPCVRDLDPARQEIVVWSGEGARLWSSNDCTNASGVDLRTLVPGQPVAFSVRWAGRTSTPGCAEQRTVVPPGAYRVMTRVDDVISAPIPFLHNP
jgi:hypothetical protein